MEGSSHSSIFIAPLHISKDTSRIPSGMSDTAEISPIKTKNADFQQGTQQLAQLHSSGGSPASLDQPPSPYRCDFQTYLRAFYPFHPTCDDNTSTVTLPLNRGDIILVHSVHTNGWADGTLLSSGARGWLPTNYCEPYDVEQMRFLLKALTTFWDLVKSSSHTGLTSFRNQDYVRGLVAGVRCLLVSPFNTLLEQCLCTSE